jgi:dynactin complex subunit
LREENTQLKERLAQYENKITGLHTQLEIKKAIREGRKVNLKMLPKRQG